MLFCAVKNLRLRNLTPFLCLNGRRQNTHVCQSRIKTKRSITSPKLEKKFKISPNFNHRPIFTLNVVPPFIPIIAEENRFERFCYTVRNLCWENEIIELNAQNNNKTH